MSPPRTGFWQYNTTVSLAAHNVEARCYTFVYWPGCISPHSRSRLTVLTKYARRAEAEGDGGHPVLLDALSAADASATLGALKRRGFLFARKAPSLVPLLLHQHLGQSAPAGERGVFHIYIFDAVHFD
jgi:hypothetical protein